MNLDLISATVNPETFSVSYIIAAEGFDIFVDYSTQRGYSMIATNGHEITMPLFNEVKARLEKTREAIRDEVLKEKREDDEKELTEAAKIESSSNGPTT